MIDAPRAVDVVWAENPNVQGHDGLMTYQLL